MMAAKQATLADALALLDDIEEQVRSVRRLVQAATALLAGQLEAGDAGAAERQT